MYDKMKENLMKLYDRPQEYCFMPKGGDRPTVFDVPDSYRVSEYSFQDFHYYA